MKAVSVAILVCAACGRASAPPPAPPCPDRSAEIAALTDRVQTLEGELNVRDQAAAATPSQDEVPTFGVVGIPECDLYVAQYSRCLKEKLPPDVYEAASEALRTTIVSWQQAAATPGGRDTLAEACLVIHEAVAESCGWDSSPELHRGGV